MNIGSSAGTSLSQLLSEMRSRLSTASTSAASASSTTTTTSSAAATTSVSENSDFFLSQLSSQMLDSLLSTQSARQPGGPGDHQPPSMDDMDSDGDGSLTQAEMESYSQSVHGDSDTSRADELFARMDTDGDGSVTADEKSSFDSQMAANRPEGPPQGAPPAGGPQQGAEADTGTSSTDVAALMQELLTALQSYGATSASTQSAASTILSVAA